MSRSGTRSVLVTGASGHLGRRVVEMLLEARAGHVIATTRHPERIHDLARQGVQVRRADLDEDVATISRAFVGAERMLLVSTDALDRQGHRLEQHQRAIAAAVSAGVRHVVYTSIVHPEPGSPVLIAPDHYGTEVALESAGLGFTVLRNNLYADLLLMSLPRAVASGRLEAAAGTGGAAYVTREDCARVAAAALASDFTGKRTLDVTGPEVVTYALLASLATELSGRRHGHRRRAERRLPDPHAAGADDLGYRHPCTRPRRARFRCWRRNQPAAVDRCHRRHDFLDATDAGRRARRLFAGRELPEPAARNPPRLVAKCSKMLILAADRTANEAGPH